MENLLIKTASGLATTIAIGAISFAFKLNSRLICLETNHNNLYKRSKEDIERMRGSISKIYGKIDDLEKMISNIEVQNSEIMTKIDFLINSSKK